MRLLAISEREELFSRVFSEADLKQSNVNNDLFFSLLCNITEQEINNYLLTQEFLSFCKTMRKRPANYLRSCYYTSHILPTSLFKDTSKSAFTKHLKKVIGSRFSITEINYIRCFTEFISATQENKRDMRLLNSRQFLEFSERLVEEYLKNE